jgi:hypothetical protein
MLYRKRTIALTLFSWEKNNPERDFTKIRDPETPGKSIQCRYRLGYGSSDSPVGFGYTPIHESDIPSSDDKED